MMVNKLYFDVNVFSIAAYKWGYTASILKGLADAIKAKLSRFR